MSDWETLSVAGSVVSEESSEFAWVDAADAEHVQSGSLDEPLPNSDPFADPAEVAAMLDLHAAAIQRVVRDRIRSRKETLENGTVARFQKSVQERQRPGSPKPLVDLQLSPNVPKSKRPSSRPQAAQSTGGKGDSIERKRAASATARRRWPASLFGGRRGGGEPHPWKATSTRAVIMA